MAFADGFDYSGNTLALVDFKWGAQFGSAFSAFLGSGHSLSAGGLNLPSGAGIRYCGQAFGENSSNPFWYVAIKRSSSTARKILAGYFLGTSTMSSQLRWNADGTFTLFDSTGTSLGTSAASATGLNTRYYLILHTNVATGVAELWIDGILAETWTGGTFVNINEWHFGSDGSSATSGADLHVDDILVSQASLITPTTIGGLQINTAYPSGYDDSVPYSNHFQVLAGAPTYGASILDSFGGAAYGQDTTQLAPGAYFIVNLNAIIQDSYDPMGGVPDRFRVFGNNIVRQTYNPPMFNVPVAFSGIDPVVGGDFRLGMEVLEQQFHKTSSFLQLYAEFISVYAPNTAKWFVGTIGR